MGKTARYCIETRLRKIMEFNQGFKYILSYYSGRAILLWLRHGKGVRFNPGYWNIGLPIHKRFCGPHYYKDVRQVLNVKKT